MKEDKIDVSPQIPPARHACIPFRTQYSRQHVSVVSTFITDLTAAHENDGKCTHQNKVDKMTNSGSILPCVMEVLWMEEFNLG